MTEHVETRDAYKSIITLEFGDKFKWATEEQAEAWAEAWIDHLKHDSKIREYGGDFSAHIYVTEAGEG